MYFILLITLIFSLNGGAWAEVKINTVYFDNTESSLFLFTNSKMPPENDIKVTSGKLEDNRIYFDIENAILTQPNKIYEFKSSFVDKIRLSQFSTDPMVVRLVFYYKDGFDPDYIKVMKADNIIVFKYNNLDINGEFFFNIYREEPGGKPDYYEPMSLSSAASPQAAPQIPPTTPPTQPAPTLYPTGQPAPSAGAPLQNDAPKIEYKLKSKYYIDRVDIRQGNILIYGLGNAGIEKPFVLKEPTRLVIDLPNTLLKPELKNKEIPISDKETLKIAQFEQSKARIVINTSTPEKYRVIYSANLQSILISNDDRMNGVNLFNDVAPVKDIRITPLNEVTDVLTFTFDAPIIHSIQRGDKQFEIILYNADGITPQMLANAFKPSKLSNTKITRFSQTGYRITIPLKDTSKVSAWETLDAKYLRFQIKTPAEPVLTRNKAGTYTVVLDPGHGGTDVGATRSGINEKDINLDVAKKVANILIKKGINVEMTHWQDETLGLQERVDFAGAKNADVFVSIHTNASVKPEIYGIETHYYNDNSMDFAQTVQNSLIAGTQGFDRGILKSKFYVINHTTMPAILVEMGFISNDDDRNNLLSEQYKQQLAEAIANGVTGFLQKLK